MQLRGSSRKIAVAILAALTLIMGVVALLVAIRLQQSQAPDDTGALSPGEKGTCGYEFTSGDGDFDCIVTGSDPAVQCVNDCAVEKGYIYMCVSGKVERVYAPQTCGGTTTPPPTTNACDGKSWKYLSSDCIQVCTSITASVFTGTSCPTTQIPVGDQTLGPGTYCGTTAAYNDYPCTQYDPKTDPDGGGVCGCKASHLACRDNTCRPVAGAGSNECATNTDCTEPEDQCGDGNVDPGEECDDGNNSNQDSCNNSCEIRNITPGTVSIAPLCTAGNEAAISVTWNPGTGQGRGGTTIRVDTDGTFGQGTDGFWERTINNTDPGPQTIRIPNGFTGVNGETSQLVLQTGVTYFVRVRDDETNEFYTSGGQGTFTAVAESCIAEGCGDTCTSNSQCPTGHSCSNGSCVLTQCVGNSACTNNGCSLPLPDTALISDEADRLIILGLALVISGLIALRLNLIDTSINLLIALPGDLKQKAHHRSLSRGKNKLKSDREKFENKLNRKADKK